MGYPSTVDTGQAQPWLLASGDPMAAAAAVATAQRAYFVGVWVPTSVVLTALRVNFGAGGAGNYDVGIYDVNGNALFRKGSGVTATGNQTTNLGTPLNLSPGTYYLAFWIDNATDTVDVRGGVAAMDVLKNINALAGGLPATMAGATAGTGLKPAILGLIQGGFS